MMLTTLDADNDAAVAMADDVLGTAMRVEVGK